MRQMPDHRMDFTFSRGIAVSTSHGGTISPACFSRNLNIEQYKWIRPQGWTKALPQPGEVSAQLVILFGATDVLRDLPLLAQVRAAFPGANLLGSSTAGEICDIRVTDESLVVTAVQFKQASVRGTCVGIASMDGSFEAGAQVAASLPAINPENGARLVHVFVLSDGLHVNGSDLVRGLTEGLPAGVTVTGGLAGDGARFGETLVFWDDNSAPSRVAAVGLYGDELKIGCGSLGGWDSFGPERLITRSKGNVLYELDGHSALGLYKKYLGVQAGGLPATGLLYPLSLRMKAGDAAVVRTILGVNEEEQSMTFAGDLPEGAYARLMKANVDRLIDGAVGAATAGFTSLGAAAPELAILISCVGRKLVSRQRVEEAVEGVRDLLGPATVMAGFYSYGEISPFTPTAKCALHNQTMTITSFREI